MPDSGLVRFLISHMLPSAEVNKGDVDDGGDGKLCKIKVKSGDSTVPLQARARTLGSVILGALVPVVFFFFFWCFFWGLGLLAMGVGVGESE